MRPTVVRPVPQGAKARRVGGVGHVDPPVVPDVGDLIRRLEGRLTVKDDASARERTPGEWAVHLINERLTESTDEVLDDFTLEQLLEHVARAGNLQQSMYYI